MFKLDPTEECAKLDDPEIDTELLYLVLDKVDQVIPLSFLYAIVA